MGGIFSAPVNKKAYKLSFDNWLRTYKNKIPREMVEFVDKNADSFEYPQVGYGPILNMVGESVKSYMEGSRTEEQTAKEIDDKVNVFLNE